jgi:hypothetical protein
MWEWIRDWLCRRLGLFCRKDPLGPVENASVEVGESDGENSDSEMGTAD